MATITAELTTGYRVEITNGRHTWRADEPLDAGGTDAGPNPYELLLGAVAACTCITLSMYAARKAIAVDSISVQYTHDKVHADDCEECDDDASGFIDTVRAQLFIEGTFTDEQRARLSQVAQRCPVRKTLERGIVFGDDVYVG
jgi:putative redox protein